MSHVNYNNKYWKYDKGRFRKPRSRKERALENQQLEEKKEATRRHIEQLIAGKTGGCDVSDMQKNPDTLNEEENINDTGIEQQLTLEDSVAGATGQSSVCDNTSLNTAFVLDKSSYLNASSPVKCDLSTNNLLPNRLRFRSKSGVHVRPLRGLNLSNEDNDNKEICLDSNEQTSKDDSSLVLTAGTQTVNANSVVYPIAADGLNCNLNHHSTASSTTQTKEMEVKYKAPKPVDRETFNKKQPEEKMGSLLSTLNNLCLKVGELDIQCNHESDGLQTKCTEDNKKVAKILKENKVLKGLVQRQFNQIKDLNDKVATLTAKSMDRNLIISGIEGDTPKEKCIDSVLTFFRSQVEIDAAEEEITSARRLGKYSKNMKRPRAIFVSCKYMLKERVMSNVSNLKDKTNTNGDTYSINKQLPEKLTEQGREMRAKLKEIKEREESLPTRDKSKLEIRNKSLYINGEVYKKTLPAPEPLDLFPDENEGVKLDRVKLSASDVVSEQGSDFQAYAFKTSQLVEVQRGYRKVRTLHPAATHVLAVYNFRNKSDHQDDDEYGSSFKLLKEVQKEQKVNIAVFVVRDYGGVKLGPLRHKLIKDVAFEAINRLERK